MNVINQVRHILKSINIPEDYADLLVRNGKFQNFKSQQVVVQPGEFAKNMYIILKGGFVMQYVHPETGATKAVNFFIPDFHPFMSVAESYFYGTPSIYELKSFTNSDILTLPKTTIEKIINEDAVLAENFVQNGIKTLIEKNTIRTMLISLSSKEMYQYLLNTYPQIVQQVPSKYIADFLDITPQWLSKLKHDI